MDLDKLTMVLPVRDIWKFCENLGDLTIKSMYLVSNLAYELNNSESWQNESVLILFKPEYLKNVSHFKDRYAGFIGE